MNSLRSFCGTARLLKSNQALKECSRTWCRGSNSKNILLIGINNKLVPFVSTTYPHHNININMYGDTGRNTFSTASRLLCQDALSRSDLKKAVDGLTDQFMEARELLEDARESIDTVYYSEDMEEASEAVKKTLEEYQVLIGRLSVEQKQDVQRTIGLKMEELKAQQQMLNEAS